MNRRFISEGHLIDSGIFTKILNLIIEEGADYKIIKFTMGKTNTEDSYLDIELICTSAPKLEAVTKKLIQLGCYEHSAPEAVLKPAEKDKCVPEDFYSTTNHRTELLLNNRWEKVAAQRMDGVLALREDGPVCLKLRDVKRGDNIVCSSDSVRVFPPARDRESGAFGFMENDVSSERSVDIIVKKLAVEFKRIKKENGKIIVVAGPVVVHTGGAPALASLIKSGYIKGLLSGNAIAVHDIESFFFGTSLGVDLSTGKPTHEGHKNHMRAINRINRFGSIKKAVDDGALKNGIMYELVTNNIPYCLAGSIRDDGPLPETEMDMIKAQKGYADIIKGTDMIVMLSTMLHSIGAGNMTPSWVKTVCVDINPAVVTKLSDRGSSQAMGIVSDVGLFLRALAAELEKPDTSGSELKEKE